MLNNCKNVDKCSNNSLRVLNNLGKASWTRRNVYFNQQKKKIEDLQLQTDQNFDSNQLLSSPWYQEGLSRYYYEFFFITDLVCGNTHRRQNPYLECYNFCRDITTEVLLSRPVGSFVVRQSRSREDCFALSVHVTVGSIVHYLINTVYQNDKKWFKIKVILLVVKILAELFLITHATFDATSNHFSNSFDATPNHSRDATFYATSNNSRNLLRNFQSRTQPFT